MKAQAQILRIDPADNVAVALEVLVAGQQITVAQRDLTVVEEIPAGHKIALTSIIQGAPVIKYGHPIGLARSTIDPGRWVHSHNLETALSGRQQYTYKSSAETSRLSGRILKADPFLGFKRPDGSVGIRNEIWIIPTVGCINPVAENIARRAAEQFADRNIDGIYCYSHPYGCSQLGGDLKATQKILAALAGHPNAGGVLILGLGCENNHLDVFRGVMGDYDRDRVCFLNMQDAEDEIGDSLNLIGRLVGRAEHHQRQEVPLSGLVLGLKCGGSDGYSGITANPLLGEVTDRVTSAGGTALLTEVPEMFGAETILMARAMDEKIFGQTEDLINNFKAYFQRYNQPVYKNPSPGNMEGGITTLEEKSLGCIRKGGQAPVSAVIGYGDRATSAGLNLLNGPGNDMVSTTALAAAGAQMVLFTTGRGTPLGGPVPTLKVASNSALAHRKRGWIDFDAGRLMHGAGMDELAEELLGDILDIASGRKRTHNEISNYRQITIFKDGVTL
jgi:altronate hydrolase